MTIFILVGVATTGLLSFVALAIFGLFVVFSPINDSCALLFGLLPFANIFKYQAGATSFFTICELLIVLVAIFKCKKVKATFILSIFVFAAYMLVSSISTLNILVVIKVLLGFCLIYLVTYNAKKEDVLNISYLLGVSTIIMLLLSTNDTYFEFVEPYLLDLDYVLDSTGHASNVMRISGFMGDPNYCGALIVISLALLCVLYYYKELKNEFWVFLAFLIPLGFLTYSKSYFLCISALILFLILFVLFPKHKGWAIVSILVVITVISMAFSGKIEVFNVVFERFLIGDIMSGRSELNDLYLAYIWENSEVLFFGEGIATDRIVGANNNVHNIYIESLFKLGGVGCLIYICTLLASTNSPKNITIKRKIVNFLPLIFFAVLFFALAGITMYELPFYIAIVFLAKDFNLLDDHVSHQISLQGEKSNEKV